MAKIDGILFDCDGVLVDKASGFLIKNVHEVLESLPRVNKAVCSNNDINLLQQKISNMSLEKHFNILVGAGKHHKPHPEVYLKAAIGLKADIFNCLAVESSVVGLKAAIASGAISVAYAATEEEQKELGALRPEFIITDMLELVELYNQLNSEI